MVMAAPREFFDIRSHAVPRRGAFSGVRPAKTLNPKPFNKNTAQKKKREFRGASLNPKRKNGRDGPPANAARGGKKETVGHKAVQENNS